MASFELRGVGINLLRVLEALALERNPDPDYWTIGRVGALLVGNHEILAAGSRWGVDEGAAGEAVRHATLTHDGRCSLIELLRTRHSEEPHPLLQLTYRQCVGNQANVFISFAYLMRYRDLVNVAEGYLRKQGPGAEDSTFFWFDLLVNDQWAATQKPFEWWTGTFTNAIKQIGTVLMVMSPWDNPVTLSRAWCVFEVYACVSTGSRFEVGMTDEENARFLKDILDAPERYHEMLGTISAAKAQAFNYKDRDAIFDVIRRTVGFIKLDSMVLRALEEWMEQKLRKIISTNEAAGRPGTELDNGRWKRALGCILLDGGKYCQAQPLLEESLEIDSRLRTEDDPQRLSSLFILSSMLRRIRKYDDGLVLALECFERRGKILGDTHKDTLEAASSLGLLYVCRREYDKAQLLLEDCLTKKRVVLTVGHPSIVESMNNLAGLYYWQREFDKAQDLFERCLDTRTRMLGADHPSTLSSMNSLAGLLYGRGEFHKAHELYEICFVKRARVLGRAHPDAQSTKMWWYRCWACKRDGKNDDERTTLVELLPGVEDDLDIPAFEDGTQRSGQASEYHKLNASSPSVYISLKCFGKPFVVPTQYSLVREVGRGSSTTVIAAHDSASGKKVAIKKIERAFDDVIDAKRILREIKLTKKFAHENVISTIDLIPPCPNSEAFEHVYIVSDLMETDLHRIIYSRQPLTIDHIQYFVYQILRGLKYLHSANVVHRDLKPSKLLLNSSCDLKINNFAVARVVDEEVEQQLTEAVVTRWYRAPEIMLVCREYRKAIDVWSVGCIFAELLARSPFFPGDDDTAQLRLICEKLGRPDVEDLEFVTSERARKFIASLPNKPALPMAELFPQHSGETEALDLLRRMLEFHPDRRITVGDALAHPFLASLHNPEDEPVANFTFSFDFENEELSRDMLQELIWQEIRECHPEIRESPPLVTPRKRETNQTAAETVSSSQDCGVGQVPSTVLTFFGEEDVNIGH